MAPQSVQTDALRAHDVLLYAMKNTLAVCSGRGSRGRGGWGRTRWRRDTTEMRQVQKIERGRLVFEY